MTKYEKYKDVSHFDLIEENGTVSILSIFLFQGGCSELFPFLQACKEYNCTVLFENENLTVKPHEKSTEQSMILSIYATIAQSPKIAEDYIRYLSSKMHDPILK